MMDGKVYVSLGDIIRETGLTKDDVYKAVEARVLKRVVLPGCVYGKYLRDEVVKVFGLKRKEKDNE